MTKQIELTQGKITLVDDADYEELNKHNWHAVNKRRNWYAGRRITIKKNTSVILEMHRQILGLEYGDGKFGDHRNRNGLDNRRANLRVVSKAVNNRNHGGHKHNTSGYTGVCWSKSHNKWEAFIKINHKNKFLGYADDKETAAIIRHQGELKYWGEVIAR